VSKSKCNANAGKDLNMEREKNAENSDVDDYYEEKGQL